MTTEKWDHNEDLIGLPEAEAYCYDLEQDYDKCFLVNQQPSDFITKSMAARPFRPTRPWLDFLESLTGGDTEVQDCLQLWTSLGLLEGNPWSKAHILYGDALTGKSTYLEVIQAAAGDYAASARPAVFTSEKEHHPAELLPFTEKRLVVLPELTAGTLKSDLLKAVTGGDAISVRGMRQNPRTETPSATLFFSANELPSIRFVDNALRRRILIWPMDTKPDKIDYTLKATLKGPEHLGGIVEWLREGLVKGARLNGQPPPIPKAVADATETYFAEADSVGLWAEARTTDGGETQGSVLYKNFYDWCEIKKRKPLSERSFSLWMGRNFTRKHYRDGNRYPVTISQVNLPI